MIVALVKIKKKTANIQIHVFELGEEWKPHKALFFCSKYLFSTNASHEKSQGSL